MRRCPEGQFVRSLSRTPRICGASLAAGGSFVRCDRGNAALEFGLLAPIFLLIFAAVADIGLVLHTRFLLNTEVSSAANYSLMHRGEAADAEGLAERIEEELQSVSVAVSCYCPSEPPGGSPELQSNCPGICSDGTSAEQYLKITASSSRSSLFQRYAFGSDEISVQTLVRLD